MWVGWVEVESESSHAYSRPSWLASLHVRMLLSQAGADSQPRSRPAPAALLVGCFLLTCPGALRLSAAPATAGLWCADLPQALIVASGAVLLESACPEKL